MNALLQHRGHNLMGAGRSIAVQNFNEQACILGWGFLQFSTGLGLSAFGAITVFGLVVAGCMWLIKRWHEGNCREHGAEVDHLLELARHDNTMDERPSARITAIAVAALLLNAFTWGVSWWPFRTLQALGVHPLCGPPADVPAGHTGPAVGGAPGALRKAGIPATGGCCCWPSGLTNVCFNWAVAVGDVVRVVLLFYLMPAWVVVLAGPCWVSDPARVRSGAWHWR